MIFVFNAASVTSSAIQSLGNGTGSYIYIFIYVYSIHTGIGSEQSLIGARIVFPGALDVGYEAHLYLS